MQFLEEILFELDEHIGGLVVIVLIKIIPKGSIIKLSLAKLNKCSCCSQNSRIRLRRRTSVTFGLVRPNCFYSPKNAQIN